MIIRSIDGNILYESDKITFKSALEEAVAEGINLSRGDFRRQRLHKARLDGLNAPNSCLWGADCQATDLAGANLQAVDMRNVDLKDACLAETNFKDADFSGAYFNNTILRQCNMEGALFSCPSLFSCDLSEVRNFNDAHYCHRGENNLPFEKTPIVINGLSRRVVVLGSVILWGETLVSPVKIPPQFVQEYKKIEATIDRFLR